MATDNITLARTIVDLVGGTDNIAMVAHCVTRLRFRLRDETLVRTSELEALDEVLQVVQVPGQCQVVIGPEVLDVYDAVLKVGTLWDDSDQDAAALKPQGATGALIDLVSAIVAPCLGCMASTSMLKGMLALWDFLSIQMTGNSVSASGAYIALNACADGFWYFFPIMLGMTASRYFKMNEIVGASLGAALCYPAITALSAKAFGEGAGVSHLFSGTLLQMPYSTTILGIPFVTPAAQGGYTATFLPVILACWASSYVFRWGKEHIPATVRIFLLPMLTIVVGGLATFLVLGPLSIIITNVLSAFFGLIGSIPAVGAVLAGGILGFVWQMLVVFGIHWTIMPMVLTNVAHYSYDFILPGHYGCTWAQIACVLAVVLKTHDDALKKNGIAAFITGFFGTTEPAIYGVTLPLRLPFLFSCIGGAASGAFYGLMGSRQFIMGYSGILALTSYVDSRTPEQIEALAGTSMYLPAQGITQVVIAAVGAIMAFVIGFVLTWLLWWPSEDG